MVMSARSVLCDSRQTYQHFLPRKSALPATGRVNTAVFHLTISRSMSEWISIRSTLGPDWRLDYRWFFGLVLWAGRMIAPWFDQNS
jgi:hypothetical protein